MASYLSNTAYGNFSQGGGFQSSTQAPSNRDAFTAATTPMYQTASNFATPQGGSRIKVAVRIRPLLDHERNQGHDCHKMRIQGTNEVVVTNDETGAARQKAFRFDQVFNQSTTQADVYQGLGLQNLVNKVIEGYHGTIFAYGQTGSGKTFTMEGYDFMGGPGATQNDFNSGKRAVKAHHTSENIGISQRCIYELYNQLAELRKHERTSGRHYQVFCSFLQIYNEKVFDLLNQNTLNILGSKKQNNQENVAKQQQGLRIRWTKKDQFVVENLFVFECQTAEEALELFRLGSKNRVLASHNLNDLSSRSHTIFCLTIESQDIAHQEMVTVSKLQLVDLAGSEKQSLTGTTGQQAKESIDINKSLLVLRKVITALTDQRGGGPDNNKMSFVPYRESKLTCLLKQSLGGNSYTLMVACLSPSDRYLEENLSTLNYAARASLISNIPTKNIDPRLIEIDEQKKKIHELEKELKNANNHIQYITQLNDDRGKRIGVLEAALKALGKNVEEIYAQSDLNVDQSQSKLPMIKKMDSSNSQTASTNTQEKSISNSGIKQVISPGKTPPTAITQTANQAKRTQMNFYLQQDKQKMDAASERLIHSVNAVTDLLKANTELRDTIEKMRRTKEDSDAEVFQLNIENQTLRERLELVEGILKNNRENYEQLVSDDVKGILAQSNTQYGKFNMNAPLDGNSPTQQTDFTIDAVYTELIQLRQHNRALETRIKQLELQNFNMARGGFTAGPKTAGPVKNNEPNRPIFDSNKDPNSQSNSNPSEVEGEEDEYDDEYDEEYDDEEEDGLQGQGSFAVRLDSNQVGNNKNLNFRRQMIPNEAHLAQLKSAGDQRSNLGSQQQRKESQPVPDQKYYTKTNFYTIGQNEQDPNISIADKFAHLHSQKMQRRPQGYAQADFSIDGTPAQHHRAYTEGKPMMVNQQALDPDFFNQNSGIRTTVKKAQQFIPMAEQFIGGNQEFDNSNLMVKRKIKKRRIINAPMIGGQTPGSQDMMQQQIPAQQTNNNISMVMVMSNLMTTRKKAKKRTSNSMYQRKAPAKFQNSSDFYF